MKNTQISVMLGQRWKSAPEEVRKPLIEREERERESYKSKIAEWRQQKQAEEIRKRQQRQAVAEQFMRSGGGFYYPPHISGVSAAGQPQIILQSSALRQANGNLPLLSNQDPLQDTEVSRNASSVGPPTHQQKTSLAFSADSSSFEPLEQSFSPEVFQSLPFGRFRRLNLSKHRSWQSHAYPSFAIFRIRGSPEQYVVVYSAWRSERNGLVCPFVPRRSPPRSSI